MIAFEKLLERLGDNVVSRNGNRAEARCPCHDDRSPSLSVGLRADGRGVVLTCHAGCSNTDVAAAVGWEMPMLYDDHWQHRDRRVEVAAYTYTDEHGAPLFEVVRFHPKEFRQRRSSGEWGISGVRRVLYRLPKVITAVRAGAMVYVAEGEKDVHALERAGVVATCNPMGAGKWRGEYTESLRGASVVIVADADEAGRDHARAVARSLRGAALSVQVVAPAVGKDAHAHLAAGRSISDFAALDPGDSVGRYAPATDAAQETLAGLNGEWPPIAMQALPAFPVDALPAPVAAWVRATAEHTQTPVDLPALAALGVLSAAALKSAVVDCGAWEEELGLYLLVAMPSGDRKSTVLRAATAPLRELERQRADRDGPRVRELRSRGEALEQRRRDLIRDASKAEDGTERARAEKALAKVDAELDSIGQPVIPRLLADDATPEALGGLLAAHGSIAVLAAESALIDNLAGRYSEGRANLHLVCAAYSGEPAIIDRKGHDPAHLDRPLLAIALVVQPHVLGSLVRHPTARSQGLVARFAYALPETRLGRRKTRAARVPADVADQWRELVSHISGSADRTDRTSGDDAVGPADRTDTADRTASGGSSVSSVSSFPAPRIELSTGADRLLTELQEDIEPRLGPGSDLHEIADWVGRHHGRVARIAGLLHLCENSFDEVMSEATMRDAVVIGEYLLAHGIVALTGPDARTRHALRWLARNGKRTVTVREIHRGPLSSRGPVEEAEELARALEALGAVRALPPDRRLPGQSGQAKSPAYDVNPRALNLGARERSRRGEPDRLGSGRRVGVPEDPSGEKAPDDLLSADQREALEGWRAGELDGEQRTR